MKKILLVTPHLSTGGLPRYLSWRIENLIIQNQVWLLEWQDVTGGIYVVQRNEIKKLLKDNLITLGENKSEIFEIIDKICPDIIHFEELAEDFIPYSIVKKIWNSQREYFITQTTHSSFTSIDNVSFLPDKWLFVTDWSKDKFITREGVFCWEVLDMPIVYQKAVNKQEFRELLSISHNKIHILNVGLFTPGKNQKEIIEIARELIYKNIHFHFVGNLADNFKEYWQSIVENLPGNVTIWGERDDVDNFYRACDIFYFPSSFELNPLSVKEAIGWGLPTFIRNHKTYKNKYDTIPQVEFITEDIEKNTKLLLNKIIQLENDARFTQ